MSKLKVILLAILVLSPSLASAKMIKVGNDWINIDIIIQAEDTKKGCKLVTQLNKVSVENVSCKQIFEENNIDHSSKQYK